MRFTLSLVAFYLLISVNVVAQTIHGMWEVNSVTVGEQSMTPVAKWFRIAEDGSYTGGNGWLQNTAGTYTYHPEQKTYLPKETNGIEDTAGPFNVSFNDKGMLWQRKEEGLPVSVRLVKIKELPKAPADAWVGLWGELDNRGEFKENAPYRFFRWDRMYVGRNGSGEKETGFWHMNAHKPEVTLLPHAADQNPESWKIDVRDASLRMTGISDSNKDQVLTYTRLTSWPK